MENEQKITINLSNGLIIQQSFKPMMTPEEFLEIFENIYNLCNKEVKKEERKKYKVLNFFDGSEQETNTKTKKNQDDILDNTKLWSERIKEYEEYKKNPSAKIQKIIMVKWGYTSWHSVRSAVSQYRRLLKLK